ncbi:ubiquitin carboxyl-terminal hydrolase 29 [Psammomys obesus]|uniref:ubiquitin carboxyl-terminal hydrolase 29 n=1 Tax=Psammomys obesus TaxID=48139 RepID=UPI0024531CDB|nr:ubiquitin carboxyl-terminal hydrolase 29 [Psammomys obesus]XP_055478142.1 ubiquitin carboxyl-terminal hydrolase 29 [Psammomys obesus]XP_055478143.1 ubiquitin carboxyl-terminal hydrolase 29 [Psammomys obesus]XP_055478144.1 ubiquitin carboxyl-terminal hydrolase 29 [Psammomys obesus]XP_055478145.1 ubiquitin carboxyl-terminal hydrolase 29 [Psammomys obesus]XP_055478146.1 ubiquitin carboxyl-terminal hydrolase 29 [Psammomys obesus]XP_055478147.1 ubiquitin carboxyl-terminal hydrolase 29 [Psammomy
MAHLKMHGFVQIRSKDRSKHTRASQWKAADIQIVERKQKVNLVVSFKLEERRRVFQLDDNVASVVVGGCELGLHHLHLTLRDDTSLLIDKLSSTDFKHLKSFLDLFSPCESQQPLEPKSNHDVPENSVPFCGEHRKPVCGPLNTTTGSGIPFSRKMPISVSNSTSCHVGKKREGKRGEKRKTATSSSIETNEDILKESNLEPKKKSKNVRSKAEKLMAIRDQEKYNSWTLEPFLFSPNSYGKPNLGDTILPNSKFFDERNGPKQLKREGFPNLGNTCYMNSILQSVFGIPTFAKDLLTQGIPFDSVSGDDLIKPLTQLLVVKDIQDVDIKGAFLMNVMRSISMVTDTFSYNEQNDAHEFLSVCLDLLKLSMEKLNAMWNSERENKGEKSSPLMYTGTAAFKRFVCPVRANFEIELQKSIICEGCGEATLKTEVSNYLSIDLHQGTKESPLSIQRSFDLFFKPEKIEHNCEKCKNKNSVLRYTLRRLPKVLIVHLKRYQVTTDKLLVKSQQPVEISKYLNISSHCHRNRKPPFPLDNTSPNGDYDISNVSQGVMPKILNQSMPSRKVTSESSDPTILQVGSDEDAEIQNFLRMYKDAGGEQQQRDLESGSKLEPELVMTEYRMLSEKTLLVADSVGEGKGFLSMICEPVSIQDLGLTEVPEDANFKDYEKVNVHEKSDCHTTTELSKYFCDLKEWKILEGSQEMVEQLYQNHGNGMSNELLLQASYPSVSTQKGTGKGVSGSSELRAQVDDPHSLGVFGPDNNPKNNSVTESNNIVNATEESNVEMEDDPQNYRLVSVVSHFGSSPNSGHYVSDVYDFQKQAWLLYSDIEVFEIPDSFIQEGRRHTGYIFFYMHNEVFEELLKKALECKFTSTSKGETKEIDLSTLFFGLTDII